MKLTTLSDVVELEFMEHQGDDASLCVFEPSKKALLEISRVFTVVSRQPTVRGNHAHYECAQLLICLQKSVEVVCDDGAEKKKFILTDRKKGLLIPPGIWAKQIYSEDNTVLMVICDLKYDPEDYIRNYDLFTQYKA